MSKPIDEAIDKAHKPYDLVTDKCNNVGIITEVNINACQSSIDEILSYSVALVIGNNVKSAWFKHDELTVHGNIFIIIAEESCHPMGRNARHVKDLLKG